MEDEERREEEEGGDGKRAQLGLLSILATFFLERPSQGVTWN